jgi:hypothetical protein
MLNREFREFIALMEMCGSIEAGVWEQHPELRNARPKPQPLQLIPLLQLCARHEVEFVIGGTVAMLAHHATRATQRLEIIAPEDVDNDRRLTLALGACTRSVIRHDTARTIWRTTFGAVERVHPTLPYSDVLDRATDLHVPDVGRIWFAGKDDLIAMKRAAGSPQDLLDIERIERGGDPLTGF